MDATGALVVLGGARPLGSGVLRGARQLGHMPTAATAAAIVATAIDDCVLQVEVIDAKSGAHLGHVFDDGEAVADCPCSKLGEGGRTS